MVTGYTAAGSVGCAATDTRSQRTLVVSPDVYLTTVACPTAAAEGTLVKAREVCATAWLAKAAAPTRRALKKCIVYEMGWVGCGVADGQMMGESRRRANDCAERATVAVKSERAVAARKQSRKECCSCRRGMEGMEGQECLTDPGRR